MLRRDRRDNVHRGGGGTFLRSRDGVGTDADVGLGERNDAFIWWSTMMGVMLVVVAV